MPAVTLTNTLDKPFYQKLENGELAWNMIST